jgi:hypothetical protein
MNKSDEELSKTFLVESNSDNVILVDILVPEPEEYNNGRQSDLVVEKIQQIRKENPEKVYSFLVDISKAETFSSPAAHTREVFADLAKNNPFHKAAIVGNSLLIQAAVNLLMTTTGRAGRVRWFRTREEALNWLKDQD